MREVCALNRVANNLLGRLLGLELRIMLSWRLRLWRWLERGDVNNDMVMLVGYNMVDSC